MKDEGQDRFLNQEEIDALLTRPAGEDGVPPLASEVLADLRAQIDRLEARLTSLEARLNREEELAEVQTGLRRLAERLSHTPGCDARRSFVCPSCGQRGLVAIPLLCTACGRSTWWGWWPPRSGKEQGQT